MTRARLLLRALCCAALLVSAACGDEEPVAWSAAVDGPARAAPGAMVRVRVEARTTGNWYFYSATQPEGGPIPARIELADSGSFELAGAVTGSMPSVSFDSTFRMSVEKHAGAVSFVVPVRVATTAREGESELRVSVEYQACNNTICLSPRTVILAVPVTIAAP
jgi:hypothetical protein